MAKRTGQHSETTAGGGGPAANAAGPAALSSCDRAWGFQHVEVEHPDPDAAADRVRRLVASLVVRSLLDEPAGLPGGTEHLGVGSREGGER